MARMCDVEFKDRVVQALSSLKKARMSGALTEMEKWELECDRRSMRVVEALGSQEGDIGELIGELIDMRLDAQ